jgi:uncharacterized protein with HEPN domain
MTQDDVKSARYVALYADRILTEVDFVQSALAKLDASTFERDELVRRAVERALGTISDASRQLPAGIKSRATGVDWHRIAAFGETSRREYATLRPADVWTIATRELDPLKAALQAELHDLTD